MVWLLLLVLAGCKAAIAAPVPTPMLGPRERYEPAPEFGGELYVMEAGPEDGPPLVLIHGLGTNGARDFAPILPALSERYHVLAFDLPGLARSSHQSDIYSPQRYAKMISALIARHFPGPVALLGHSMGAALAIQVAADHPEQVERLMLLDVAGVLHYREYLREVIAGSPKTTWTRVMSGTRSVLFSIGMFPTRRMQLEDLALEASPTLRGFFSSSRTAALLFIQHDFGPAIRRVKASTFLGWGAQDTVAPQRTFKLLRASLPVLHAQTFERSGHVPMRTEPREVGAALRAFLDAPLVDVAKVERPGRVGRHGSCEGNRARVFEGDYDRISIHRCKDVVLRNVRARELSVDRSEVQLEDVELVSNEVAATFRRSRVRWTGGSLRGEACVVTDASALDFAGVRCEYRADSLRVLQPSTFISSASVLSDGTQDTRLHGAYQLFRTQQGKLKELASRPQGNAGSHTTLEDRSGAWLQDEDMTGAPLRGADMQGSLLDGARMEHADLRDAMLGNARLVRAKLHGADLRGALLGQANLNEADLTSADLRHTDVEGASFKGAWFDATTQFPAGFDPRAHGMREHVTREAP